MPSLQQCSESSPILHHPVLHTTFRGILHSSSSEDVKIHQYRGIKYASVPARFRQSKLHNAYPSVTDASQHGPICPQVRSSKSPEEALVGGSQENFPQQHLKHNEFECLNLNITCPAGLTAESKLPVMLWVHGGGDRGSGSHWMYDGGNIVRKSIEVEKPVILVTFNFRIGLLGFAASPIIRDDNKMAGEDGTGNYGLHDQRKAMEWLHHYIAAFGGDPDNITLFGAGSGGADIICHMLSAANASRPMFSRAIIQSAIFEPTLPDIASAGWHLSRLMSALQISTIDQFRAIEVDKIVGLGHTVRAIDDGVFFRKGWEAFFGREDAHMRHHRKEHEVTHRVERGLLAPPVVGHVKSRSRSKNSIRSLRSPSRSQPPPPSLEGPLQPLLIGDCSCDSLLWSVPISIWTSAGVVRRLKAICQSLSKANGLLRTYDISPYTPDDEIVDRVLELVNDARVAWPTECIVANAKREHEGRGVWRYVFDQEGPARGIPHYAVDLIYLFDNVPLPASMLAAPESEVYYDGPFDVSDSESEDSAPSAISDDEWARIPVDEWSYTRVRDAIQERWLSFAHGEAPWQEDKVFVFGPEGETGERSQSIFEGRRRRQMWKQALDPLGPALVQKIGVELSRGPSYHC